MELDKSIKKRYYLHHDKPGHMGKLCPTYSFMVQLKGRDISCMDKFDELASDSRKEDQ